MVKDNNEIMTDKQQDTKSKSDAGILVLDDIVKNFGGLTAVDNLSFQVQENEILGFIGPNGAGKSTTFNCVTGQYAPTSGAIYYKKEDITGIPAHEIVKKGLARTFQDFSPLKDRSVLDNILLPLLPKKVVSVEGINQNLKQEAKALCDRVGLGDQLQQTPDELTHAGLLRLEIARALATDPDLILIDEPFAGLSELEVKSVSALLSELRNEGKTLVVVDHNMRGLLSLVDRAIVINFGSLLVKGTPEEIKSNQKVQQAYLGGEMD
jgi:branched-chain amino acid transport system ATP-binding protein